MVAADRYEDDLSPISASKTVDDRHALVPNGLIATGVCTAAAAHNREEKIIALATGVQTDFLFFDCNHA